MGASGSIDSDVSTISGSSGDSDICIEGDAMIYLDISTLTADRFHKMECRVGEKMKTRDFTADSMNVAIIKGCGWKHSDIPNPDFADNWFSKSIIITSDTLLAVNEIAMQSNLFTNFREQYVQPLTIPSGMIFIDINFQLSAIGSRAITKLTGCVPKLEMARSWEDTEMTEDLSSMWQSRIQELFPGEIPKEERIAFKKWWTDVDSKFERVVTAALADNARSDFAIHLAKQTTAYRRYINSHDEHYLEESQHWRSCAHADAHRIIGSVVNSFYTESEALLARITRHREKIAQKLQSVKKSLQSEFETAIFDLAKQLEENELASWKSLEDRFKTDSFDDNADEGDMIVFGDAPDSIISATSEYFDSNDGNSKPAAARIQPPKTTTAASKKTFDFQNSEITSGIDQTTRQNKSSSTRMSFAAGDCNAPKARPRMVSSFSSDSIPLLSNRPTVIQRCETNPMGLITGAMKKSSMNRLSKILEIQRSQLNRQQDSYFITATRFSFEEAIFEMMAVEKMTDCLERTESIREAKWTAYHTGEVKRLQATQSKERTGAVNAGSSTVDLEQIGERHKTETDTLSKEFEAYRAKQRADFDRGSRRTLTQMQEKMTALRESAEVATLSSVSSDKFKAICVIYEMLRS